MREPARSTLATEVLGLAGVDALYGDSHVLHGVTFGLEAGRVLALLGRNGAGKTTCMSAIIGFLPPRAGEIRFFGEPITRLAPEVIARKGIGFVPQGRRVFPTLSVKENLIVSRHGNSSSKWNLEQVFKLFPRLKERSEQYAGSLSGGEQQMLAIGRALMGLARERWNTFRPVPSHFRDSARQVLARVALESLAARPVAEVAYGEKRRVEIAMALAQNPKVLLLDEPLAGLSREERAQVKALIGAIPRDVTVVMIEHDMDTALDMAERITVLHYGKVIVEGTRAEVVADPKTREVYLGH